MNPSTRSEVLREADQGKEQRGKPGVDTVPRELCPNEPSPSRDPVRPHVPGEGAFKTFADGAGI
jgi:hypothetical protein